MHPIPVDQGVPQSIQPVAGLRHPGKALAKAVKNRPGATGEARLRQAYSLLRTILNAAVKDRLISENPCQIEGAGQVNDPERPYLSPEHLAAIVGAMPEKWHLPVRVAFGAHLRVGELEALERGDYANGALRVERQRIYVRGHATITPTKTGRRGRWCSRPASPRR